MQPRRGGATRKDRHGVREAAPQNFRRGFLRPLHALAGWFLLYVAVGGLLGFGVLNPHTSGSSCVPFNSFFGAIESACPNETVNIFWSVTIGWPRLLIVFPALAISLFKAAASNGDWRPFLDGAMWLLYSAPVTLIICAGTFHWWKHRRFIGVVIATITLLEILVLGVTL